MTLRFTSEEIEKITKTGIEDFTGRCSCAIQDEKPSYCKNGPYPDTRMPVCGFYYQDGVKKGVCLRCGMCCALPRKEGSQYGVYDPNGSRCEHLVIKEI